ncbi:SRPBCC family protein [Microbacterium sp. CFBP9034]|uniref:SRPBCC family protein n=1 Tax=Microbacterium sp. CFBP9034 TaxID=3096540 RepID=UPI002A69B41C|nr:SRPBCC family protein [Microbacterium sp. CFBP9034]MDY0911095.1 SRPBCC family protein [Microbacterium sp. CFBP9034]
MWKRVVLDVHLPHPPQRVFRYLADPARWPDFAPAVAFRQLIGDVPPDVGSRWWAVDRIGPFRVRFADVLESIEPGRRVVWHSTSPWNSRVEYVCLPENGGTRMRAEYEGDIAGWLGLTALLPAIAWEWILMRDFFGLTRLLDEEDRRHRAGGRPDARESRPYSTSFPATDTSSRIS